MGEEVKLLGVWGSPFSSRVEIALRLKGVQYEFFEEDLHNKSALLLKSNPVHKKIPVLLHNDKPIAESHVVLEYIDETWKQGFSILPEDPFERAHARFWARFLDEKCLPAIWKACWGSEEPEKAVEEACELLKLLEHELKGNKFFGGEKVGLVDIVGNFIAYWLRAIQEVVGVEILTKEKFPKIYDWSDEFVNVLQEILPRRDKLVAIFRGRFESTTTTTSN
ncbi:glutathione S-transferase U8-like [Prunus avium]|uniref:glutathione transferase n=1 Tax=Prunus avium TaxID=42229 RepID=A0A6P5TRF6_PRUAV|nr:glutathione S-transferase U8-like [Prunus avium]